MTTTPPSSPPILGFSELVLVVADLPRAAHFYREILGLTPARPQSDSWAWFWAGPPESRQRLAVHAGPLLFEEHSPRPPAQRFGPTHFAFHVPREHLGSHLARLRAHHIPLHGPVRLEWMLAASWYFYDPDANLVELWTPD